MKRAPKLSRNSAIATCMATRALPKVAVNACELQHRPGATLEMLPARKTCQAGASPNTMPVSNAIAAANRTSAVNMNQQAYAFVCAPAGEDPQEDCSPERRNEYPNQRSCHRQQTGFRQDLHGQRPPPAPRPERRAISRSRDAAWASRIPDTLTQASSKRIPTSARSISSGRPS